MAETNKQRKARLKREKEQASKPIVTEEEEYEEEELDETNDYVSPLEDMFSNVQNVGTGVKLVHDMPNDHILLDIDYGTRRGISSTGTTVKIANASYSLTEKMKLNMNIWDKEFNAEELVLLEEKLKNIKEEKRIREAMAS